MKKEVSPIQPRSLTEVYRGKTYTLRFDPETTRVDYVIQHTRSIQGRHRTIWLKGNNADFTRARKAAQLRIDEVIDGK